VQTPSRVHVQNKRRRMAFYAKAQRLHSVAGDCKARTSALGGAKGGDRA